MTADPSFLLWVTPGRDWSSEIVEHDDVITIDLTDIPLAADAAHATVTVATTKRETTDIDPDMRVGGYFSYLIVFHDKNNETIGALSIGPVSAPNIAQGG